MNKIIVLLLFLNTLFCHDLSAAYVLFNNRNHSELNWQIYKTDNFDIVYSDNLSKEASEVGKIAELSYDSLSVSLEQRFNDRYTIFVSDMDDIANGGTTSFGYFLIYVNCSEYKNNFTGTDSWLRKVIAHEMVHALLNEKTTTWLSFFWPNSFSIPRDINEGMAQFYSGESWGYARGDHFLNLAISDDNLSLNSNNLDRGGLLYAQGFSKIRNLNSTYPDSVINKIFNYRNIFKLYDFKDGFKEAIGISYDEFNSDWQKNTNVYYNWREGLHEQVDSLGIMNYDAKGQYVYGAKYSPSKNALAYTCVKNVGSPYKQLFYRNLADSTETLIAESGISDNFNFSPDGKKICFSRMHYGNNGSMISDIFVFDLISRKEQQITKDLKAFSPIFIENNKLLFLKNDTGIVNFYISNVENNVSRLTNFKDKVTFGELALSHNKKVVVASYFNEQLKAQGIATLNLTSGKHQWLIQDSVSYRNPIFVPNSNNEIVYTAAKNDLTNIYKMNLQNKESVQITNQANSIIALDFINKHEILSVSQTSRQKTELLTIDVNRKPIFSDNTIKKRFAKWRNLTPKHQIDINKDQKYIEGKYEGKYSSISDMSHLYSLFLPAYINKKISGSINSVFADKLFQNQLVTYFAADYEDFNKINYGFTYLNRASFLNVSISYYDRDLFKSSLYAGKNLLFNDKSIFLALTMPFNRGRSFYKNHFLGTGFSYEEVRISNKEDFNNNKLIDVNLAAPQDYYTSELLFNYKYKKIKPYSSNGYNPINALGINAEYSIENTMFGGDFNSQYLNLETFGYYPLNKIYPYSKILQFISQHDDEKKYSMFKRANIYVKHGFKATTGNTSSQNKIGINKYIQYDLGSLIPGLSGNRQQYLRGNNKYYFGNRLYYYTVEFNLPLTNNLGIGWPKKNFSLNHFGLSFFLDGAYIWNNDNFKQADKVLRNGFEFKTNLTIINDLVMFGGLSKDFYDSSEKENYYFGIKTFMPF